MICESMVLCVVLPLVDVFIDISSNNVLLIHLHFYCHYFYLSFNCALLYVSAIKFGNNVFGFKRQMRFLSVCT